MNNFAVYILSHGRAGNVKTYHTLRNAGYTGKIYVVIDDEDKQGDLYREEFGDECVVFCKQEYMDKADTISLDGTRISALFARLFIMDIAKDNEYYLMIDDDVEKITFRYPCGNSLKSMAINNADYMFEKIVNFMKGAKLNVLALQLAEGLIGGLNGIYKNGLINQVLAGAYLLKGDTDYRFFGSVNEDTVGTLDYIGRGGLGWRLGCITITTPVRGSNSGGLSSDYNKKNWYYIDMHAVVVAPWCCKIDVDNENRQKIDMRYARPRILSEVYKKGVK